MNIFERSEVERLLAAAAFEMARHTDGGVGRAIQEAVLGMNFHSVFAGVAESEHGGVASVAGFFIAALVVVPVVNLLAPLPQIAKAS